MKILGGSTKSKLAGGTLPAGLKFRDVLFSASAREALKPPAPTSAKTSQTTH